MFHELYFVQRQSNIQNRIKQALKPIEHNLFGRLVGSGSIIFEKKTSSREDVRLNRRLLLDSCSSEKDLI